MAKEETTQTIMFAHIVSWQNSDLSQKEWCRQNAVSYHVFHYWYRRYREQHPQAAAGSFVRLMVEQSEEAGCEVVFSDGTRVVFHKPVSASYLRSLLF